MPEVSVIVPVYNVEKYLNRCIDSILNQTFTDFELILIDDGSIDSSGKICDEYAEKDSRIKVIHKKNAGVSAARNTGIDLAIGKYIMFVDSDDYIDREMLFDMIALDPADIICSGLKFVSADGGVIIDYTEKAISNITMDVFLKKYFVVMEQKYILSGPYNKLFKKEVIDKYKIYFDENISICEDGLFVTMFLKNCNTISNVDKSYYNYVQYGKNTLMCRYNNNAIEAAELLYNTKLDLLSCLSKNELLIIKSYLDNSFLNLFINFYAKIFSCSGLNSREKYRAARKALSNKTFCRLLVESTNKNAKKIFLNVCARLRLTVFAYLVYKIRWGVFRRK